jgi:hypothetical protein
MFECGADHVLVVLGEWAQRWPDAGASQSAALEHGFLDDADVGGSGSSRAERFEWCDRLH